MPLYGYRCARGHLAETHHAMGQAPATIACRDCGDDAPARRLFTTRGLGRSTEVGYRAIEASARSAHEPEVVTTVPRGPSRAAPSTTSHPLHRTLPRP